MIPFFFCPLTVAPLPHRMKEERSAALFFSVLLASTPAPHWETTMRAARPLATIALLIAAGLPVPAPKRPGTWASARSPVLGNA